jgi:uncharacterized protein
MQSKRHQNDRPDTLQDYLACVEELLGNDEVLSMRHYSQHRGVDCLMHCLNVSYSSYRICRLLGLDYRAAARGGLLHDFFLYDWHVENPYGGLHGFTHPKIAVRNAERRFNLSEREKDVIKKHMWPLTPSLPKYAESFVVLLTDKFFCVSEGLFKHNFKTLRKLHGMV